MAGEMTEAERSGHCEGGDGCGCMALVGFLLIGMMLVLTVGLCLTENW